MKDKLHLIWIQIEAGGLLTKNYKAIISATSTLSQNFIEFRDMICAAPTTIMSTLGMLTGVQPVRLAETHTSKKTNSQFKWNNDRFPVITDYLEGEGYAVHGFNFLVDAPDYIPFFHDYHQGVSDSTPSDGTYWQTGVVAERVLNIKENLSRKPIALFFHIYSADFTNLIKTLQKFDMTDDNSICLIVGDHGVSPPARKNTLSHGLKMMKRLSERYKFEMPGEFDNGQLDLEHDLHLTERKLRVVCFLSFPKAKGRLIRTLTSALDLAPTVLDFLGFDSKHILPEADGISLLPLIKEGQAETNRIIRVDSRYIHQKNRIIALVDPQYRYIFRFDTSWENYPFYKYCPNEIYEQEELYDRFADPEERYNLARRKELIDVVEKFRQKLVESHTRIMISGSTDRRFGMSSEDLLKECLKHFVESSEWQNVNHIAIYGAGKHTKIILDTNIIDHNKISAIFEDNPDTCKRLGSGNPCLDGIPIMHPAEQKNVSYELILISSGVYENEMLQRAKTWLPKDKLLVPLYRRLGHLAEKNRIKTSIEHSSQSLNRNTENEALLRACLVNLQNNTEWKHWNKAALLESTHLVKYIVEHLVNTQR